MKSEVNLAVKASLSMIYWDHAPTMVTDCVDRGDPGDRLDSYMPSGAAPRTHREFFNFNPLGIHPVYRFILLLPGSNRESGISHFGFCAALSHHRFVFPALPE